VVITLFCVIAALALADRFGQRPTESHAAAPAARMTLTAPDTVRGGPPAGSGRRAPSSSARGARRRA